MLPLESCRILIMDDNVGQACLVQSTLARAGYIVELAPGRAEGLTRHAKAPYDVLLIDHNLPGMDGLAVLETLGTWGTLPSTIMVTGHGNETIAVEAMKRGASDYLVKDVEGRYLTLLPVVVARVLQQHCLAAQKRQAVVALQEILTTPEQRVQVRTADLRRVNAQLRAAITRRQRAEATLARLSQQHQLILAASSEGIYGIDRQGKVTFINPAAVQMLGWKAEALHGQVMHDRIHHTRADGTRLPWAACPLHDVLQQGGVYEVREDVFWRQDGSRFLVEYTATPICEHGEVLGAVVLFRDITARTRAAQERQRVDRLALVGQLASGLAHEIGTPLNIIGGNAEFLRMQTFARSENEPMTPVVLEEPLAHALRLIKTRFQREGIMVTVDVPPELPLVWFEPFYTTKGGQGTGLGDLSADSRPPWRYHSPRDYTGTRHRRHDRAPAR